MLYWRALCVECAGMLATCKNRCLSFSGHSNRFMLHAASSDLHMVCAAGHCFTCLLLSHHTLKQKRLNEDGEEIDSDAEDQEPTAAVPDKKKNSRLCSECCSRVAIRACNECGDKFCTKCYKFLHSTGTASLLRATICAYFSRCHMWWSRPSI
jgi:hypothetical protein